MRVPVGWLREYCDPALEAAEIADALTMAGVKLERLHRTGVGDPSAFVVGRVLEAERHPNAERLSVCQVADGSGAPRTIVCGAPNVTSGQTVAIARPGAVMPDGTVLGEAELRGVISSGMILAEDELGIGDDHSGVLVLDNGSAPGAPHPEVCLRFSARVFEDVTIGPSPAWLKQRLMAAGQRPISNAVDITNYVMLLTGQPLHAFDLDRVRGSRIVVRRAHEGETMTTLDGVERRFGPEVALVCDAEGPSGIAGVMGGQVSEVSDATTRVLMEAATWVGPNIMRTARDLALRTEASARFEKGLHPELAMAAQRLDAKLMVELCGARLVPGTLDAYPRPAAPRRAGLRLERIESLLGAVVPEDEVRAILARLGFTVEGDRRREERAAARPERAGGTHVRFEVTVPPWREGDVQREADLIEEVARIHGLGRLPSTLPARTAAGNLSLAQRLRRRLEDALRDRGLFEVASYSFTSEAALARLRLDPGDALRIGNPLSEEGRVLRPLLLPGLLEAARHNAAHGRAALALFESAHVYAHSSDATAGASGVREVERRVP